MCEHLSMNIIGQQRRQDNGENIHTTENKEEEGTDEEKNKIFLKENSTYLKIDNSSLITKFEIHQTQSYDYLCQEDQRPHFDIGFTSVDFLLVQDSKYQ